MRRQRSRKTRKIPAAVIGGLVLLLALLAPAAALVTGEGRAGGKLLTGDTVEVDAGETHEGNLYAFAGSIDVNGTVDGDLVAAGGQISIDGTVTGDLTVAGGQLTVAGEVLGDIRYAGGQLTVDGPVGGDVAVVGGSVELDGDIDADVLFAAGQVTINGDVTGQIYGGAGDYDRSGTVGGPEDVTIGEEEAPPTFSDRVVSGLYRYASLFVVGALVLLALRRPLNAVVTRATNRPVPSLLTGLIALAAIVGVLILTIVAGIVWSILFGMLGVGLLVGTYWFAFITLWVVAAFTLFALVVYAAPIVTALVGGRLALPGQDSVWVQLAALAVGLGIFLLVTAIPVVGWLLGFLAVTFATGAIVQAMRKPRVSTPEPVPVAV